MFKSGSKKQGGIFGHTLAQHKERRFQTCWHRLVLECRKGLSSDNLLNIIMKELFKWLGVENQRLHCLMILDNLRIQTNDITINTSRRCDIYMLIIMPETSHWFQIHDQIPLANLKKKLSWERSRCWRLFSYTPGRRNALLMVLFYKAYRKAFNPCIVRRSFPEAGLWLWNPKKNWRFL